MGRNNVQRAALRNLLIAPTSSNVLEIVESKQGVDRISLQRITMKKPFTVCICWLTLTTGLFAQAPTAPTTSASAATATVSATATPDSSIERSVRKKQINQYSFTI